MSNANLALLSVQLRLLGMRKQRLIHLCLETAAWGSMCFLGQLEREETGSTYSCSKDPDFHQLKGNAEVQQPVVYMSATQETQSELQFNSYT